MDYSQSEMVIFGFIFSYLSFRELIDHCNLRLIVMVLDTSVYLDYFFFFWKILSYFFFISKKSSSAYNVDMSLHSKQCWITDLLKHLFCRFPCSQLLVCVSVFSR